MSDIAEVLKSITFGGALIFMALMAHRGLYRTYNVEKSPRIKDGLVDKDGQLYFDFMRGYV